MQQPGIGSGSAELVIPVSVNDDPVSPGISLNAEPPFVLTPPLITDAGARYPLLNVTLLPITTGLVLLIEFQRPRAVDRRVTALDDVPLGSQLEMITRYL